MPEIVKLEQGAAGDVGVRGAEVLRQGRLVAYRTAGGWRVIGRALLAEAARGLGSLPNLDPWPSVVLGQAQDLWDWLPHWRGPGLRMARRLWPGPLNFLVRDGFAAGLWSRLPAFTRDLLAQADGLPLAIADAVLAAEWTRGSEGPLLQAQANVEVIEADQAAAQWGADVSLLIDTPVSPSGRTSWVEVRSKAWRLLTEGAVSRGDLEKAAPCRIVFVCTGNTCRSPLADALARKLLAEHLGCAVAELPKHGFCVQSAGLAAMMGGAATPEAEAVAHALGADLSAHQAQPLNLELIATADYLLTMTVSHLQLLESLELDVGPRPQLLSPAGLDIDDPIGSGPEVYQACAARIMAALEERLPEFLES